MSDKIDFTGYRWHGIAKCPEDPRGSSWQQQKQAFFDSLNWDALCQYASRLPIFNGKACTIDSQITTGGRNMVRLIHVEGGSPCVARVRMSPTETNDEAEAESQLLQREVNCIKLVKERISVPVPAVSRPLCWLYSLLNNRDLCGFFGKWGNANCQKIYRSLAILQMLRMTLGHRSC